MRQTDTYTVGFGETVDEVIQVLRFHAARWTPRETASVDVVVDRWTTGDLAPDVAVAGPIRR